VMEADLSADEVAAMEPEFDTHLYAWEQDYFIEHFVRGHQQRLVSDSTHEAAFLALAQLRQQLGSLPRCLVHRDFQSQNVLIRASKAWLVDYQGLRPGLAEYDLASLLFDPYVPFQPVEREQLLQYYATARSLPVDVMRERLHLCAAQRLMQALGAYANLSRNLGKKHFEQHIPAGLANLEWVCQATPALQPLLSLFSDSST
jgi:N-acetylmuramate 1-kinase